MRCASRLYYVYYIGGLIDCKQCLAYSSDWWLTTRTTQPDVSSCRCGTFGVEERATDHFWTQTHRRERIIAIERQQQSTTLLRDLDDRPS